MKTEMIPIADLKVDPENVRVHDERNLETIRASLEEFGQQKPIVVDARGYVVAGNGTLVCARDMGWQELACVRTSLDGAQLKAYAIADNRTSDLSAFDDDALLASLRAIEAEESTLVLAAGYDDDEYSKLISSLTDEAVDVGLFDDVEADVLFPQERLIDEAFAHFRKRGFPYRKLALHEQLASLNRLASLTFAQCESSTEGYHVADTYHAHRFEGSANGKKSPLEAFADDRRMRRAIELVVRGDEDLGASVSITKGKFLSMLCIVLGTQSCANFRPPFAMRIYRQFCKPGSRVLDTSTGYGGRLLGALASQRVAEYVGIDPSTKTHAANHRMADVLCKKRMRVTLLNEPAEDVTTLEQESFDFAFTSPPYFVKEEYADEETQSFKRYPEAADWRDKFLARMFELQYAALKHGARSVVNIADVKIRGKLVPVTDWALDCADAAGFTLEQRFDFNLTAHRFGSPGDSAAAEPVFVFVKS